MLEKIKTAIKYVFLPLSLLFAGIYYLLEQNKGLKRQVEMKEAEKELAKTLTLKEEVKKDADAASADWDAVRSKYIKPGSNGGDV